MKLFTILLNLAKKNPYPVGSIYMSINNTNPSTLFGGTWEQIKDTFLLSAGDTYTAGDTGGDSTHTHTYGLRFGTFYYNTMLESNSPTSEGVVSLENGVNNAYVQNQTILTTTTMTTNNTDTTATKSVSAQRRQSLGYTTKESSLPPYLTVYMWKRTT